MNNEYRRNHYIPECYLKGFSDNEKMVWIYNKKISKSYPKSVNDIFVEKDFYLIDESFIPEEGRGMISYKSIEYDFFAKQIESQYADFLKHVKFFTEDLKKQDLSYTRIIPEDWVERISLQLLIQYIRTPEARRKALELLNTSRFCLDIFANSPFLSEKEKEDYKLESQKTYGDVIDHFMVLFNKERVVDPICSILQNKIWSIYFSPNADFFTSDSPVILEREGQNKEVGFMEFNLSNLNITYPVTRNFLVRLWDRESYKELVPFDRIIRVVDEEFVKCENIRQYVWANNEIVSSNNNSTLFKTIVNIQGKELYCKH